MSKIMSVAAALISLASATAQAPTAQIRLPLIADAGDTSEYANSRNLLGPLGEHGPSSFESAGSAGDFERFQIDEMNLPKLNVDLPELFDWSDGERSYFANGQPLIQVDGDAYAFRPASFRTASVLGPRGGAFAGGSAPGGSFAQSPSDAGNNTRPSSGSDNDETPAASNPTPDTGTAPPNGPTEPSPLQPLPPDGDAPTTPSVPVPVPGTLGLFVLGLAGLRFAVRKKNGSG